MGQFGPDLPNAADVIVMQQQLAALHAIQDVHEDLEEEEKKEDDEVKDDKDIAEMKKKDLDDP